MRESLREKYKGEKVLVVDRCFDKDSFIYKNLIDSKAKRFLPYSEEKILDEVVFSCRFELRWQVERTDLLSEEEKGKYDVLQLIPYLIVKDQSDRYLLVKRETGGEGRLQGNYSIGQGGHINPVDKGGNIQDLLRNCIYRELEEEIDVQESDVIGINFMGLVYNPQDSVGRDHLGLVYEIEIPYFSIGFYEENFVEFKTKEGLKKYYNNMEVWSRVVYDSLILLKIEEG